MSLGSTIIAFCSCEIIGVADILDQLVLTLTLQLAACDPHVTRLTAGKYMWRLLDERLRQQWHQVRLPSSLNSSRLDRIGVALSPEIINLWIESATYVIDFVSTWKTPSSAHVCEQITLMTNFYYSSDV